MTATAPREAVHVITGGGSGLGRASAHALGGRLLLADLDPDRLAEAAAELAAAGATVEAFVCDVADPGSVAALAERARGMGTLGALVHAAGVCPPGVTDSTLVIDVNLLGTVHVLDAFEPLATVGSVGICLASVGGHRQYTHAFDDVLGEVERARVLAAIDERIGLDGTAIYAYGISKRGVLLQVARRAGRWGARGARLVSISPGHIGDTAMGASVPVSPYAEVAALRRAGRATEIASVVRFLASEEAAYVTGCDLRVDGGTVAGIEQGRPADEARAWHMPPELAG